jgi:hypothetical protein
MKKRLTFFFFFFLLFTVNLFLLLTFYCFDLIAGHNFKKLQGCTQGSMYLSIWVGLELLKGELVP